MRVMFGFSRGAVVAAFLMMGAALFGSPASAASRGTLGPGVPPFRVRQGYRVTLVYSHLNEARFLEFDNHGTLFVSQPGHGRIVALRDPNNAGVFQKSRIIVSHKHTVQGMCYHRGWLWFTQTSGVFKMRDRSNGSYGPVVTILPYGSLPGGGAHWWRSIVVTNHAFYTSVGDPQNDSDQTKTDREKIWRYALNGKSRSLFCGGIRNTEKLRFRPGTHELWGCDEGSDQFGYPLGEHPGLQPVTNLNPPDELNHYIKGGFYGHPFVVGNNIPRYEWLHKKHLLRIAAKSIPPAWDFHAHWSTVAMCFLKKRYFPGEKGDAFVACHGSWDSTRKVGYCVARVLFDRLTGKPFGLLKIVKTISKNRQNVYARPVDCAQGPDGSVYFSSDSPPRIFRITYIGPPDASNR